MLPHNSGLIPDISPSIWLGGQIPYKVVNETGDWRPYIVRHEKQKDPLETMACVSFSLNNCLEIQTKFYGNEMNYSDRFLAKMSGTQPNGNTLEKVADTARNIGLVLESEWPNEPKATTWAEYYKEIPEDVKAKAVKQNFQYEWVARTDNYTESLKRELKQSPLQITIYAPTPNHAVTLLHVEGSDAYIQDHYLQTKKIKVSDISIALKIVSKPMNEFVKTINNKGVVGVVVSADTVENYKFLCKQYGIDPKIQPDGTILTDIKID